jgi:polar amino acid transport system substrate-binding protein
MLPFCKTCLIACCTTAFLFALPHLAAAQSFTVITNSVPPFKFLKNGKPSGMAGDLLTYLFRITGHSVAQSRSIPMAQFLHGGYKEPGSVFLSLSKGHQQNHGFKFVGPIFTAKSGIIVKKSSQFRLARIHDAKAMILASVINSAPEKGLMGTALEEKHFLRFTTPQEAIKALVTDKADGLLLATAAAYHLMAREGIDTNLFETALTLDSIPLYFAFHADTPDHVIEQLQATLDEMKQPDETGMSPYLKIISAYY